MNYMQYIQNVQHISSNVNYVMENCNTNDRITRNEYIYLEMYKIYKKRIYKFYNRIYTVFLRECLNILKTLYQN